MKKFGVPTAILLAAAVPFAPAAQACAVCLTGAGTNDPIADAFNWSVLFLMAMPYVVVGSIAGCLFLTYRRRAAHQRIGLKQKPPLLRFAWTHKENGK